jgi:branched-chain amino acid transport system ATP-binding protein
MALVLESIDAGYGLTPVLRRVDLIVPDGAAVALIGPNGAGKSTLMRVIAGLLSPTTGRITFDGADIGKWDTHRRAAAGICLIPEGRGIFPTLSVRENLVLQARKGTEKESIERAADAFPRLRERLAQRSGTLSGGEQQMLALARAYIRQPKVVLLDEVSFGLAPVIVDEIFEFLGRLAAEGTSLLIVEQYVDRALALARTVHLLQKGELRFTGSPDQLRADDVYAQYLDAGSVEV